MANDRLLHFIAQLPLGRKTTSGTTSQVKLYGSNLKASMPQMGSSRTL
jgi:hypothetical protein